VQAMSLLPSLPFRPAAAHLVALVQHRPPPFPSRGLLIFEIQPGPPMFWGRKCSFGARTASVVNGSVWQQSKKNVADEKQS
jgi:hypothetical protein